MCATGFTLSAINGQYDDYGTFEGKRVYRNGSYYLFYDVGTSKWYIDTHIQTTPVAYEAYSITKYIGGQWYDVDGVATGYFVAEGNCSSASSSSNSSSSSTSYVKNWSSSSSESSSTEWMSSSSVMGCPDSVEGIGFTTFIEANGTYNFSGYYDGKPKYENVTSAWRIQYESMDVRWCVYTDMGVIRYYSAASPMTDCPSYWLYKLRADDSNEGYVN